MSSILSNLLFLIIYNLLPNICVLIPNICKWVKVFIFYHHRYHPLIFFFSFRNAIRLICAGVLPSFLRDIFNNLLFCLTSLLFLISLLLSCSLYYHTFKGKRTDTRYSLSCIKRQFAIHDCGITVLLTYWLQS